MAHGGSRRAVVVALFANLGIAVSKTVAAIVTGSGSMLAEAIHSYADSGNQVLLLIGDVRSQRPPNPQYPLGYGREAYFWALIVAMVLFGLGGMFSGYEGLHKLRHPEPLEPEFTPEVLESRLATSRQPVKPFLLDQTRIAGIGNIYAVEALWRARISPRRRARNVGPDRAARLHRAIVQVLEEAVENAGTTLGETALDYVDSEGATGAFQDLLAVYDREGEPCLRCGTPIRRILQGQRSTYFCPGCQR